MLIEMDTRREGKSLIEMLNERCLFKFWTRGKNVSPGWVAFRCVYCQDESNHLGINIYTGKTFCWKCGSHNFIKTIMKLTGCSITEAHQIKFSRSRALFRQKYQDYDLSYSENKNKDILPKEIVDFWPDMHLKYMKKRNFEEEIILRYKLKPVYTVGRYKFRIIIPIILNGKIVSFISRDVTEKNEKKYLMPKTGDCLLTPKQCIYNYDNLNKNENCILVEGPTDVWRMGDNTISFLGTQYNIEQIRLFKKKKVQTAFILYDNDVAGQKAAINLSKIIAPLVQSVEIVSFSKNNDPGSLSKTDAELIKRELGFII